MNGSYSRRFGAFLIVHYSRVVVSLVGHTPQRFVHNVRVLLLRVIKRYSATSHQFFYPALFLVTVRFPGKAFWKSPDVAFISRSSGRSIRPHKSYTHTSRKKQHKANGFL